MNGCERIRDLLVLYSERALSDAEHRSVEDHVTGCTSCAEEAHEIDAARAWLSGPELFQPEQDLAWQLLPQKLTALIGETPAPKRWIPVKTGSIGWAMSMAASLILACGLIWMLNQQAPDIEPVARTLDNDAILSRMQSLYAREATARYLTECQDLLVNLVGAEQNCAGSNYDVSLEVVQARELLKRKRLLEAELRLPDVALAKGLCDELESFLIALSTSQECETSDEVRRMERFIEKEKLMLRISLLQSELS